ncbi:MAG TPA: PIN domain-containing protein [Chloroflexota bacterium]|nr:PIN domain-containing protein [Chloroflexota bacterium]
MVAAVLDTNILASVLASGFVRSNPQAAPVRVLDAWRAGAYTLVVSEPILAELVATLRRPYFRRRLSSAQLAAIRGLLRRQAVVTPLTVAVRGVATHLEDDLILATALSAAPPTWSPATPSSSAWAPTRA